MRAELGRYSSTFAVILWTQILYSKEKLTFIAYQDEQRLDDMIQKKWVTFIKHI